MHMMRAPLWRRLFDDERGEVGVGIGAPGGGDDSGAAGAGAPFSLSDDVMVMPPGATEAVKWKDYIGGYSPRADFDREQAAFTSERTAFTKGKSAAEKILLEEARKVEGLYKGLHASRQPQPANALDTLTSRIKGQPFADGDTILELVRQVKEGNIDPMMKWATQANTAMGTMAKKMAALESRLGVHDRKTDDEKLGNWITKTLEANGFDPKHELLREQVENYYYSWEPQDGQSRDALFEELPKKFATGMTEMRKLFRDLDRQDAEKARKARLPSRGGSTTPSAPGKYKFETPREIAARIDFGEQASPNAT